MRLLLDTHILLWWLADPRQIAPPARAAIRDPQNMVFYSAVSIWEISIKVALGKIAPVPRAEMEQALASDAFEPLAITPHHAWRVAQLPPHHADPFDRILVAQALEEAMTLVTRDRKLDRYEATLLAG